MKKSLKTLLLCLAASAIACAQGTESDRILGVWSTPNQMSKVEISKCGEAYCGTIKWMKNPANDVNNPELALRQRPLLGARIMNGFRYAGGETWNDGVLYGPERGKEVSPKLVLASPDTLEIKVSAGMAHKTITWTREK